MKYIGYIIGFLVAGLMMSSCTMEDDVILDLRIAPGDISGIELRGDHKTLIPNGVCEIAFRPLVYSTKKVTSYLRDEDGSFSMKEVDTVFLVPADQVPEGSVKIYDGKGNELKNGIYSTTTDKPGAVLEFYARGGSVESNRLSVTVRGLPDESYGEVVVPVIFHLLLPPATAGPTYEATSAYLEEQLQRVSDVFNRRVTTDPNGGNPKITFKLALYNPQGVRLQEPGKNIANITATSLTAMGSASDRTKGYKAYILEKSKTLIWDPNKYLNVWLAAFSTQSSVLGGYAYQFLAPEDMHPDYTPASIPGLKIKIQKEIFTVKDVTDCLQAGVLVNYSALFNPQIQSPNDFALATVIGGYYGLLNTNCNDFTFLNSDGDNDYCPDTYSYYYQFYKSTYKGNNLDNQPENEPTRPMEYFTSFNIMDMYSRKNSVSADQTARIRKVLTQCPSRWGYKSSWGLTGVE